MISKNIINALHNNRLLSDRLRDEFYSQIKSTEESLALRWCEGFKLPENLEVGGDLDLEGCEGLTKLPEGLKVRGSLYLIRCVGLSELPENLEVGGYLSLRGCVNWDGIVPKNIRSGQVIR